MRLLLDTHIWIWCVLDPGRLSDSVAAVIRNKKNELWLSPVSLWELVILAEGNRIQLGSDPVVWARKALQTLPLQEATITQEIALAIHHLNLPVRDPADRLLAATAKLHDFTLVTADRRLLGAEGFETLANA